MPAKGVAVVTGASYGLGASIAKQLACKVPKYEVVLVARFYSNFRHFHSLLRSKEKLRELQFEIAQENGVALVVEADITDAAAVQNLLDTTLKAFPKGVDVLVNNAAYVAPIHRSSWGHKLSS